MSSKVQALTRRAWRASSYVRVNDGPREQARDPFLIVVAYPAVMVMAALFSHYTAVSQRLGLAFEDGRIHGVVDGVPLQMWFGGHSVHTVAVLIRSAPIEIGIATKGLVAKAAGLFGSHTGEIGDPEFDRVFRVKTADPARAAALLTPDARKALLEVASEELHPAVDSHSVHLRRFSHGAVYDNEAVIERDFREAARLSRILGQSFGTEEYR